MKLPAKVHIKNGRYYYVHQKRWHALTRVEDGEPALLQALAEFTSPRPATVGQLFDAWLRHEHPLATVTLHEYQRALETMSVPFGKMPLRMLTPGVVAQYLERRGGVKANREVAALGTVCAWAMRQGWLDANPTHGVRRNTEKPRERYVSNREFADALRTVPAGARDFMLAGYLTGLRQGDLRALRKDQVTREGILVKEGKRGKRLVVTWSGPLKALVHRAVSRSECDRVFTNEHGQPWTLWAVQSFMRRLEVDWRYHDIRAKAESDHKTGMGLLTRYKRARRVSPVGSKSV
jgi:integrase